MEEFKKPNFLPKTSTKSSLLDDENEEQNISETTTPPPKAPLKLAEEQNLSEKVLTSTKIVFNLNTNLSKNECSYKEPEWSAKPANQDVEYKFEILKSGSILEEIRNLQTKKYWVIGRLEQNDIALAHPTISRFHAVFQFRKNLGNTDISNMNEKLKSNNLESGWYIYDLGSTHGTFLNKMRVPPKTYIRVHVGHILKFGASLRSYILQGPVCDEEPESEFSVTELKERKKQEDEFKVKKEQIQEEQREKEGISWGMTEDADEETDLSINPYATTNNEELFLDDPKKTLRGFFEREGLSLDYKCEEMSSGTFVCRIDLPLDDTNGKQIVAEICHKGKKKECVAQCALEACRILDRYGVLRQSHHEPLKRKALVAHSDDEDDFLDRTGDIQRKKLKKAAAGQNVTLTYDDLIKQENEFDLKLKKIESEIALYQENCKRVKEAKAEVYDDLDNYMENLAKKSLSIDKTEIKRLRVEEQRLRLEIQKIKKVIKIAKPFDLPPLSNFTEKATFSNDKKTSSLPLFGKRNKFKFVIEKTSAPVEQIFSKELKSDEEEFDEDDEISNNIAKEGTKELNDCKEKKLDTNCNDDFDFCKGKKKTMSNSSSKDEEKLNLRLYGPFTVQQELLELNSTTNRIEEFSKPDNSSKTNDVSNNIKNELCMRSDNQEHIVMSKLEKKDDGGSVIENEEDSNIMLDFDNFEAESGNQTNKKRKHRTRNRQRRENVDIDDYEEFVDAQKHSDWVPPKNQSGDGRTSLNDKFGY